MPEPMTYEQEYSSLLIFFNRLMQESFEGNDATGNYIQDLAVSLGLARRESYDPKRHGPATHCEEGDEWIALNVERYGMDITNA